MEEYYSKLDKEFFSVGPSFRHKSKVVVRCLKCSATWEVPKEDAKKDHGILRLLDHEYGHRNRP